MVLALSKVIESLNGLQEDMQRTIDSQKEGDIEQRCNSANIIGAYSELYNGVNEGLDILGQYDEGNLEIKTRTLPGKQIVLTSGLDGIQNNLIA